MFGGNFCGTIKVCFKLLDDSKLLIRRQACLIDLSSSRKQGVGESKLTSITVADVSFNFTGANFSKEILDG